MQRSLLDPPHPLPVPRDMAPVRRTCYVFTDTGCIDEGRTTHENGMAYDVFSREWVDAWRGEIGASDEYRKAARKWEWPVLLVARADAASAVTADRHVFLDLARGECREARLGTAEDSARAHFVLSADAGTWQDVLAGKLDPVGGIARGRIRLEKGSLMTLAMNAGAAKALVATAARVSGDWPRAAPGPAEPLPPASGLRERVFVSSTRGLRHDILPMRLFRKAKRLGIWNPEDIDFARDRRDWRALSDAERDVLLRLTSLFIAGEESVTLDLLPLVAVIAREGRVEEEMYLTTFLWEEAKHVDFFDTFLRAVAPGVGDLSRYHSPAYHRIFYDELPRAMNALATDSSPAAQVRASATYNMIVEGVLAETGYQGYFKALEANALLPGLREGIAHLQRDEARHIAYGVFLLSRLIAEDAALWGVAEARMNELFPIAVELIGEMFAAYDVVPFGMQLDEFVDIATTNFARRIQRIEKARGQTLVEVLRTAAAEV